jgi:iodotyrosine deiodinase
MNPLSRNRESAGEAKFIPLPEYRELSVEEMTRRAKAFFECMRRRRTVRHFSPRDVPAEVIEACLASAATAPSGANLQPWHFVVVSDPAIKRKIAEEAEKKEHEFYDKRAPKEWLQVLSRLGTNPHKPYLVTAPYLIVVFQKRYGLRPDGTKIKYYYTAESVGIATGILIAAIHQAGLVALPHTPSPMRFLNDILDRPTSESPFLILVVGYPAEGAIVPDIRRKALEEVSTFF